ncbi:CPBP family glutamic-type intramembrane protease [Hathewaya histolytica]|uniref:CAAX amino terminal protease family protein n=1 Tax=Hathewaya histolytica TaxID=1498 RepID=A0A4U9RBU3_HATHI|nr:CPBP family intramembrane glutamic endopeptidase [Hathewaya histolytica]VTQ89162.1 CAAX amino terminal protease family protein [Hathewaya histolytica]
MIYENTLGIVIEWIFSDPISQIFMDKFNNNLISTTILIVIVAPICEEILFRGIILEMFLKKYSTLKSILVSALMFGIIHGNFIQGVETFFIAIILGYIYYKTNSLLPCIFLHFVNNFIYILSLYGIKIESTNFSLTELIIGVIILISSYFIYIKFIKTEKEEKRILLCSKLYFII